jgi:excisionase family DNA binding protein
LRHPEQRYHAAISTIKPFLNGFGGIGVDDRWLSVGEATRALGMSRTTLLAAEESGLLTAIRTPGGHRRYPLAEIERYQRRCGLEPVAGEQTAPARHPAIPDVGLVDGARAALRSIVRALDGDCAAVYGLDEDRLRFCAAFGIPRWLTDRLADSAPPVELERVLVTGRLLEFDAGQAGFPEPRATGNALALPLGVGERRLGVLCLLTRRDMLAGERRVAEAFAELVGTLLADRAHIAELKHRLHRIAELSTP